MFWHCHTGSGTGAGAGKEGRHALTQCAIDWANRSLLLQDTHPRFSECLLGPAKPMLDPYIDFF